jgi:multiple sugar transport system permease protein
MSLMSTALAPPSGGQTTGQRGRPVSRRRRARLPKALHFLTFAAPGLAAYLLFVLLPIGMSVRTSFTNRSLINNPGQWVGLRNYTRLFSDADFTQALKNTIVITVIITVVANAAGLAIALLLDRRGKVYNAMRAVFFTPVILSGVVVSVIWRAILTDDGLLYSMLRGLGWHHPPGWLSNPDYALYSVAFILTWQILGFCVVVYLAGLQGVPQELMEAAEIDGAGKAARFRNVTWPMLAPALTINTVMLLISGFKVYDQVQVMTNGGPGNGTTSTIAFDVVQTTFTENHIGYGAAMGVVMLVIIAAVSVVALRFLQRREITL